MTTQQIIREEVKRLLDSTDYNDDTIDKYAEYYLAGVKQVTEKQATRVAQLIAKEIERANSLQ